MPGPATTVEVTPRQRKLLEELTKTGSTPQRSSHQKSLQRKWLRANARSDIAFALGVLIFLCLPNAPSHRPIAGFGALICILSGILKWRMATRPELCVEKVGYASVAMTVGVLWLEAYLGPGTAINGAIAVGIFVVSLSDPSFWPKRIVVLASRALCIGRAC